MELGEYLSMYRKQADISIDSLAEKSGVPKGTINKIISGDTRSPTLDTVKALARTLNRSINDFMDDPPGVEKGNTEKSAIDRLSAVADDLTEQQALFLVKIVEELIRRKGGDVYAAAKAETRRVWRED